MNDIIKRFEQEEAQKEELYELLPELRFQSNQCEDVGLGGESCCSMVASDEGFYFHSTDVLNAVKKLIQRQRKEKC